MVLIICPNCGARYKLSEGVLARGARLRCAACDHRWVPEAAVEASATAPRPVTEADEEAAFAQVQAQMQARWESPAPVAQPVEAPVEPAFEPEPEADEATDEPRILKTVLAVIAGAAMMIVAVGLWVDQVGVAAADLAAADLAAVPGVEAVLANFEPPTPLRLSIDGTVTPLASGKQLLEVTGAIANPGPGAARVPALVATLSGPRGVALRWTIPAPVKNLGGGRQVAFASTVTGFPADATELAVRPGR